MIRVCIDPGHGGNDRYNVGPSGYIEADGVLKISKYLKEELEATGQFEVILTRDRDATLGLTERGRIAANNKVNLFVSEHTNAGPPEAGGTVVFYSVDLPGDAAFASRFSSAIAGALGIRDRGAKTRESTRYSGEDYYTVIDSAQDGGVPHVLLVESAFHSNPYEEKLLLQDSILRKIAKVQAQVIYEYFKGNTAGSFDSTRVLKVTTPLMRGEDVRLVQQKLMEKGFNPGVIDGVYGVNTEAAVKRFQASAGIPVNGIVDSVTRNRLFGVQASSIPALVRYMKLTTPYMRGEDVKLLQTRLMYKKISPGMVDGIFGPHTDAAVKYFQKSVNIQVDGIVGPVTWKKLFE